MTQQPVTSNTQVPMQTLYRIISLLLLFVAAGTAVALSALAVSTREPLHVAIALNLWWGAIWYLRFRRRQLSTARTPTQTPTKSIYAITPAALLIVVAGFATSYWLLESVGWLARPGGMFLFFAVSGSASLVGLVFLVVNRSKRLRQPSG